MSVNVQTPWWDWFVSVLIYQIYLISMNPKDYNYSEPEISKSSPHMGIKIKTPLIKAAEDNKFPVLQS